jgi:hypothetical protein
LVAIPTFVFQLERLNRYRVGVRIEVGKRLELGNPASKDLIGQHKLTGFVVDLDDDIFAEILEG